MSHDNWVAACPGGPVDPKPPSLANHETLPRAPGHLQPSAADLVLKQNYSFTQASRSLGMGESSLRGGDPGLSALLGCTRAAAAIACLRQRYSRSDPEQVHAVPDRPFRLRAPSLWPRILWSCAKSLIYKSLLVSECFRWLCGHYRHV